MKYVGLIAWILLIVGGLNWGLVGAFDLNVVEKLLGAGTILERIVYILVGLSAIYMLVQWRCVKESCCSKE